MGKVAVVTGGGAGIGLSIAEALLAAGYAVVIAERDAKRLTSVVKMLTPLGQVRGVRCDVSREADVRKLMAAVRRHFGDLDLLVNNAAIADPKAAPLPQLTLAAWRKTISVNLDGVFLCVKYALPMLTKARGSIVNISSTRAVMSEPHTEAYAATKGALDALTHALAISHGPAVRVNCIRPGWIDTRADRTRRPLGVKAHRQHPVGRVGVPEDVAGMVIYLASDKASFVTGQVFTVDGGMSRKMIYDE